VVGGVSSPYRLIARTTESTWIRVRMGDGRSSDETVPPGEVREWVSDRPFTLTVGNAGGVSLELNGRALPPLGPRGAVIPRLVLPPESR
jgi:cytoskeleton protein RodZ